MLCGGNKSSWGANGIVTRAHRGPIALKFFNPLFFLYVGIYVGMQATTYMYSSEDSLSKSILFFHMWGPGIELRCRVWERVSFL